jgi:hypothetical protein
MSQCNAGIVEAVVDARNEIRRIRRVRRFSAADGAAARGSTQGRFLARNPWPRLENERDLPLIEGFEGFEEFEEFEEFRAKRTAVCVA